MTGALANEYEELHLLVDRLPLERVRALRAVALYLVEGDISDRADTGHGNARRRRLSFAGIMDAEPDLAARSEEILREELGRRAT
jgi:hypothetical protein